MEQRAESDYQGRALPTDERTYESRVALRISATHRWQTASTRHIRAQMDTNVLYCLNERPWQYNQRLSLRRALTR
jgi:hypothetical protein